MSTSLGKRRLVKSSERIYKIPELMHDLTLEWLISYRFGDHCRLSLCEQYVWKIDTTSPSLLLLFIMKPDGNRNTHTHTRT